MTFPFTWRPLYLFVKLLKSYAVVSQGIGMPEEQGRDTGTASY